MRRTFHALLTVCLLVLLASCGGSKTEQNTVFVEAGSVARVATDKPQPVAVKDSTGKDHVENRNIGGMIVMPKTNYDELRRGYLSASVKADPSAVAPTPKPTALSPVELAPEKK